jgi:hypothetical protein
MERVGCERAFGFLDAEIKSGRACHRCIIFVSPCIQCTDQLVMGNVVLFNFPYTA